jgi:hypothetical protein
MEFWDFMKTIAFMDAIKSIVFTASSFLSLSSSVMAISSLRHSSNNTLSPQFIMLTLTAAKRIFMNSHSHQTCSLTIYKKNHSLASPLKVSLKDVIIIDQSVKITSGGTS